MRAWAQLFSRVTVAAIVFCAMHTNGCRAATAQPIWPGPTFLYEDVYLGGFNSKGQLFTYGGLLRANVGAPWHPPIIESGPPGYEGGAVWSQWDPATGDRLSTRSAEDAGHTRISPDGDTVAEYDNGSCEACDWHPDGEVRLYDTRDMKLRRKVKGEVRAIRDVAFSPDSRTIIVSYIDDERSGRRSSNRKWNNLRAFDVGSGKQLFAISAPPVTQSACYVSALPDGRSFAVQNINRGVIEVRDFRTGKLLHSVADDRPVELDQIPDDVSVSLDSKKALLTIENVCALWASTSDGFLGDVWSADEVTTIGKGRQCFWMREGHQIAAYEPGVLSTLDADKTEVLRRFELPDSMELLGASHVSPWVALSGGGSLLTLNTETGEKRWLIAPSPDLLEAHRLDAERKPGGQERAKNAPRYKPPEPPRREHPVYWSFLDDGSLFVYCFAGYNLNSPPEIRDPQGRGRATVWDRSGKCVSSTPLPVFHKMSVSPNRRWVAVCDPESDWSHRGYVWIYDAVKWDLVDTISDFPGTVVDVEFTPDSTRLVVVGRRTTISQLWRDGNTFDPESEKNLRLYDVETRKLLWTQTVADPASSEAALTTHTVMVAVAPTGPTRYEVHDLRNGKLLKSVNYSIAFSPDGSRACWIDRKAKRLVFADGRTLREMRRVSIADPMQAAMAILPEGVVSAGHGFWNLLDAEDGTVRRALGEMYVLLPKFSADRSRFAGNYRLGYESGFGIFDSKTGERTTLLDSTEVPGRSFNAVK